MTTSSYALSAARTAAPGLTSTFYGRIDELLASRFAVDVEGLLVAVFTGCTGLAGEIEVEAYAEGGLNDYEHKLPGRTSYGNVTLTGGIGNSILMYDWFHQAAVGNVRRRDISVVMYMRNGFEAMRWNLTGAFPRCLGRPRVRRRRRGRGCRCPQPGNRPQRHFPESAGPGGQGPADGRRLNDVVRRHVCQDLSYTCLMHRVK